MFIYLFIHVFMFTYVYICMYIYCVFNLFTYLMFSATLCSECTLYQSLAEDSM